jgi:hypothetical protein
MVHLLIGLALTVAAIAIHLLSRRRRFACA